MDEGASQATVHGFAESDTTERLHYGHERCPLRNVASQDAESLQRKPKKQRPSLSQVTKKALSSTKRDTLNN